VKDGYDSPWSDDYKSADEAVAALQREFGAGGTLNLERILLPSNWSRRLARTLRQLKKKPDEPVPDQTKLFGELVEENDEITTWDEFEDCVRGLDNPWIFRAQSDASWRLLPRFDRETTRMVTALAGQLQVGSLERLDPELHERKLLEFWRQAYRHIMPEPADGEVVDLLADMQHYGGPTRLLDWTRSPYIALYFALGEHESGDCAVWALDVDWLNATSHRLLNGDPSLPAIADCVTMAQYTNRTLLNGGNRAVIVLANPARQNDRLKVQEGHFLCNLSHNEPFDITLFRMLVSPIPVNRPVVRKLIVKGNHRRLFLDQLQRMQIDKNSLFPGVDFAKPCEEKLRTLMEEYKAGGKKLSCSKLRQ